VSLQNEDFNGGISVFRYWINFYGKVECHKHYYFSIGWRRCNSSYYIFYTELQYRTLLRMSYFPW
jgi:hypothetical protein